MLCVVPCVCSQKAVGLAGAGQAPEVCDGHRHFGTGYSVVVRRCPSCFEVYPQVTDRHVINKGVRQRHLESFGGTLAVFIDAHSSQLAQLRVVEAGVKHVEAVGVGPVGGEAKGFVVVQGAAMEVVERREAVGVQATDLSRAAHGGYGVTQS